MEAISLILDIYSLKAVGTTRRTLDPLPHYIVNIHSYPIEGADVVHVIMGVKLFKEQLF